MSKIRINDLALELEVKSKTILDVLPELGVTEKKTHSSALEEDEAERVRSHFRVAAAGSVQAFSPAEAQGGKTRIDLSHISKPGDVLKAILQHRVSPAPSLPNISKPGDALTSIPRHQPERARSINEDSDSLLELPKRFSFYTPGFLAFDHVIQYFDWSLKERAVMIDLSACTRSNYQVLALLVQYAWYLTLNKCTVKFKYGTAQSVLTKMLTSMGALDWREILVNDGRDFGNGPGRKTYALRRRSDVQSTINNARRAIRNYEI